MEGGAAQGLPVYGETLHQYACFNAEYYKNPRAAFCLAHLSLAEVSRRTSSPSGTGWCTTGSPPWPPNEYPTSLELKLRGGAPSRDVTGGNVGAEARNRHRPSPRAWSSAACRSPRFADVTATNAGAESSASTRKKGVISPGSDADLVLNRSDDPQDPREGTTST